MLPERACASWPPCEPARKASDETPTWGKTPSFTLTPSTSMRASFTPPRSENTTPRGSSAGPSSTAPCGSLFASSASGPSCPIGECVPLLKFDASGREKPHLCEAGLAKLAELPPPVSVVSLMGDGRCGKSTLASRLIDDERLVFPVGDTGTAVTDGIDMVIVNRGAEGSLVVLDCEGGNNPTGAIRGAVDLVAMLSATLTVQVVWGQMSEGQLLQIGQGLAVRDRLLRNKSSTSSQLQAQKLLLVVNGCHLRYLPDQLQKTFLEVHTGTAAARNELRANIKRTFEKIHFVTVPSENDFSYLSQLETLRTAVDDHCGPASLGGVRLSGAQIAELLKTSVSEFRDAGSVPVPSVFRHVIYDHLLKPLVNRLLENFKDALPDLSDNEFRPLMTDTRSEALQAFDSETTQLTHHELVAEAREDLRKGVDILWQKVIDHNTAVGEQDRDVSTESEMRYSHTEERVVSWKRSCMGIIGKKTPIIEACSVFRVWTRTRVLKKNGQVAYSDWAPSAHNVDGSSCLSNVSGSRWNALSNSHNGVIGERNCTPASPLMSKTHSSSSPNIKGARGSWGPSSSPSFKKPMPPSPRLSSASWGP